MKIRKTALRSFFISYLPIVFSLIIGKITLDCSYNSFKKEKKMEILSSLLLAAVSSGIGAAVGILIGKRGQSDFTGALESLQREKEIAFRERDPIIDRFSLKCFLSV